ncbi:SDR family oxidoreductase [Massilia sp. W12]|uniref:SDR family oxidoreductase n=1 Tax=Massilia sp. W12 TaxID=3126507 RepID=UPI0030CC3175
MERILITGASGLLGSSLLPAMRAAGWDVTGQGRKAGTHANYWQGGLDSRQAVHAMLDALQPQAVINLAALTNVDLCEEQPQQAYDLNVRLVQDLASWLAPRDGYLVHISSDQVYDGSVLGAAESGSTEAQLFLQNTYAFSKVASELAAQACHSACLRSNFYGKSACPGRPSFSDWIINSLRQGQQIKVFQDVWFSPLSIASLCRLIPQVLQARLCGVYNLGSREGMSKADFAFALAQAAGLPTEGLQRSDSAQAALRAKRPRDMRMDCGKLEQDLQQAMPRLADEITQCGREYRATP